MREVRLPELTRQLCFEVIACVAGRHANSYTPVLLALRTRQQRQHMKRQAQKSQNEQTKTAADLSVTSLRETIFPAQAISTLLWAWSVLTTPTDQLICVPSQVFVFFLLYTVALKRVLKPHSCFFRTRSISTCFPPPPPLLPVPHPCLSLYIFLD